MKHFFTLLCFSITILGFSKPIIWATKGEPKINDSIVSIQHAIILTDVITLDSKNDYICIYDDITHKILELQGVKTFDYTHLESLLKKASKLPEFSIPLPQIRKGYYQLGSVSRRPPIQQVFPIHLNISVGKKDTLMFKVIPSPLEKTFFDNLEISNYFGEISYRRSLKSNDHIYIKIPVKEFTGTPDELPNTDTTVIYSRITNNNSSASSDHQIINVKSKFYITRHRAIIKQLLSKNTIAYNTCAILYALENDLVFDALKISQSMSDSGLMYDGFNLHYQQWKFTLEGDTNFRKHY